MLKRCLVIFITFFILLTSTYAASYYDPTPEDEGKLSVDPITFRIYDEELNITNCDIVVNGIRYNMTYEGYFCEYNVTGPMFITEYTFRGYFNNSEGILPERTFTYYPSKDKMREVPFASVSSIAVAVLLLLGGLVFS